MKIKILRKYFMLIGRPSKPRVGDKITYLSGGHWKPNTYHTYTGTVVKDKNPLSEYDYISVLWDEPHGGLAGVKFNDFVDPRDIIYVRKKS